MGYLKHWAAALCGRLYMMCVRKALAKQWLADGSWKSSWETKHIVDCAAAFEREREKKRGAPCSAAVLHIYTVE